MLLLAAFIGWALPLSSTSKIVIYLLLLSALLLPFIASLKGIQSAKHLSQVAESRRQKLLAPLAIITQLLLWQQWQTQTKDYTAQDDKLQALEWKAQKHRSSYMLLIQWFCYAAVLVVLFSIYQLTNSSTALATDINVPLALAVTLGLLGIQEIIVPLGQHYLAMGNSISAKDRLNALLHPATNQPELNITATDIEKGLTLPTGQMHAELCNVSAKIPGALVGAKEVSISVQSGMPLIIKGPSGCGKSTLLQALAGELPVQSGEITLNEQNWFAYDWQDQLGYLGQQLDIFDQTLAANLRLGKPDATEEELLSALDKVGLLPWLQAQPQGLQTALGEYGAAISGGQARRVALARLLLKPRKVLLLDEPFAGLDTETRERVWNSVREHQKQGLLIIVSHHEWDMGECEVLTLKENVFID